MLNLLKKPWWKYISIVLLLYALIAGMYIPLSSGITNVTPEVIVAGAPQQVMLKAYNTHFDAAGLPPEVILKNGDINICADAVSIINLHELQLTFNIPATVPIDGQRDLYDVIIYHQPDGTFALVNGVSIQAPKEPVGSGGFSSCSAEFGLVAAERTTFPYREILYESIRNLYFHVPMWFTMTMLLLFSFISSIVFINKNNRTYDVFASQSALVALLFGVFGILTGMTWANYTWGQPWPNDPKLNGAAVGMLIYLAYFVLRGSLTDELKRAKVAAVYNIFGFVLFIVFIFVLPRLTDSLHPGNGGNPAFGSYDLDNTMRPVFYSAAIGFIILGHWIMSLRVRYVLLQQQMEEKELENISSNT